MSIRDFPGGPVRIRLPTQGHGFDLWSKKIPCAAGQVSPSTTTTELESCNYWTCELQGPFSAKRESPAVRSPHSKTRQSPWAATNTLNKLQPKIHKYLLFFFMCINSNFYLQSGCYSLGIFLTTDMFIGIYVPFQFFHHFLSSVLVYIKHQKSSKIKTHQKSYSQKSIKT